MCQHTFLQIGISQAEDMPVAYAQETALNEAAKGGGRFAWP